MAAVQNQGTGGVYSGRIENQIYRYRLSTSAPFPKIFLKSNKDNKKIIGFT